MKFIIKRLSLPMKIATLLIPLAIVSTQTNATPIDSGFDVFYTPEYSTTISNIQVNTPTGAMAVGDMAVTLEGTPISFWNPDAASLAGTDTIVARKEGVDFGTTPNATIDIELVALSLKSVDAIDLTPFGLGMADMYVVVGGQLEDMTQGGNGDGVCDALEVCTDIGLPTLGNQNPSIGQMTNLTHENANGGTFDSFFDIFVDLIFTEVGNQNNILLTGSASDQLVAKDVEWTHTAPASYPLDTMVGDSIFLQSGNFHVGKIIHDGPHPIVITVPEPSSLLL